MSGVVRGAVSACPVTVAALAAKGSAPGTIVPWAAFVIEFTAVSDLRRAREARIEAGDVGVPTGIKTHKACSSCKEHTLHVY
jgi:hypothetical protein